MRPGNPYRWSCGALPFLGLLLLSLTAAAQEQTPARAYIDEAIRYYQELEYERAQEELRRAQAVASNQEETASLLLYQGIILSELNQPQEASAAFRAALQLQPTAALPLKVSPKIAQSFEAQRAQFQPHAAAKPTSDRPTVATEGPLEAPALVSLETAGTEVPLGPASPQEQEEVTGSLPWFKRWYVWTAVGAVVTAAAVGAVVATRDDGAPEPLSPGDVCGNGCDEEIGGVRGGGLGLGASGGILRF